MTDKEINCLFRFLKEIDVFHQYIRSLKARAKQRGVTPKERLGVVEFSSAISDSFIWSNTVEGYRFWNYIDAFLSFNGKDILSSNASTYMCNFDKKKLKKLLDSKYD